LKKRVAQPEKEKGGDLLTQGKGGERQRLGLEVGQQRQIKSLRNKGMQKAEGGPNNTEKSGSHRSRRRNCLGKEKWQKSSSKQGREIEAEKIPNFKPKRQKRGRRIAKRRFQ